ncbi:helix-turn-helix domain-containing protein [Methylobacterium sp. J-030]|uniref:XRE family transcriptional regulator n=1 Tax=Methylobacterium sp. J-030 TaxID=2836627 RepID=UPI001FBBA1D8|nr:XRE family transcriptional regulator [Methylobacterium sp. J-030]MCJ2067807.1 helix-turn-helix domain-containing protein [Methylobacterium sp. J-030]
MPTPLGNVIKEARKARKITQGQIAAEFGITRNAVTIWETSDSGPQRDRLPRLADLLGIDLAAAMRGEMVFVDGGNAAAAPKPQPNVRRASEGERVEPAKLKGPRDVPVLGTGVGGDEGDFRFNGQTIDYAPRPPGIEGKKDVFVVYIVGDSMAPRFEDGDPAYIDPHRRPKARDYVVVELKSEDDGEAGDAFVKRLVRRSGGKVVVEQHNPPKELVFDEADIARVHRVIPWTELIGI